MLTRANNRSAIETWQHWDDSLRKRVSFIYHDLPKWAAFWKRGNRGIHLYYYLWQISAARQLRRVAAANGVQVVHHVTLGTYWLPSAASLTDIPYVFGPVGGGEDVPPGLWKTLSLRGRFAEGARFLTKRALEHDPMVKRTVARAGLVLATTAATADRLRHLGAARLELMPHVGARDEMVPKPVATYADRSTYHVLTVSRLLEWKGVHMAVRAVAALGRQDVCYDILGEGPQQPRLERLAKELGISRQVRFHKRLPSHADVLQLVASADVFVHLAMHESGGMGVAEAMAAGVPCIVLATGGPGELVDRTCGVPISPSTDVVQQVAEALNVLLSDVNRRRSLGEEARRRVERLFSWPDKAARVNRLYSRLTGDCGSGFPA